MFPDDSEMHAGTKAFIGKDACREAVRNVLAEWPDRRIRPIALAAGGDVVFVEMRWEGTASADGAGVALHVISVLRLREGRVANEEVFQPVLG